MGYALKSPREYSILKAYIRRSTFSRLFGQGDPSFTLVELLVVVAILGLLAGLLIPATQKAIAAGKTGKATGNLRQIGILINAYAPENNNCLPILIDWNPQYPWWGVVLSESLGLSVKEWKASDPKGLRLAETFYDPSVAKQKHPCGDFGANDAIMLGIGGSGTRNCATVFGHNRGTPISAIGTLSKKVIVTSAIDGQGLNWKSSWYFHGPEWVAAGPGYTSVKPDPRHGGKTLCLFADGHTELLDTDKMSAADRRKYFLLPQFE